MTKQTDGRCESKHSGVLAQIILHSSLLEKERIKKPIAQGSRSKMLKTQLKQKVEEITRVLSVVHANEFSSEKEFLSPFCL